MTVSEITYTAQPCMECGERATITVPLDQYRAWLAGTFVQEAFPTLTPEQRELFITGIHPECWEAMFADEEGAE